MILLPACVFAASTGMSVDQAKVRALVDSVMAPLVREQELPGLAVGVTIHGKKYFFNYGVASKKSHRPVDSRTLFEIGSISKTFTATLASYAQVTGRLSWADPVSKYLPGLRGSSFGRVRLINFATHTTGGLPLQVPVEVKNFEQLMGYLRRWKPATPPGTSRTYSNISIGLLGAIAAKSLRQPFDQLMERTLFPRLGMDESYLHVPADQMARYAQGYTKEGGPIRMSVGVLASEAYGVKSSSADLLRFVLANLQSASGRGPMERAISLTHTGYFTSGALVQDLIWEQYPYPVQLKRLLAGNSVQMILESNSANALGKPLPPQTDVLIDKTGSTNGFGAYVAFIPSRQIGIVMLANKSYPIPARVTAAFEVMSRLVDPTMPGHDESPHRL